VATRHDPEALLLGSMLHGGRIICLRRPFLHDDRLVGPV
jgi:hypothetical protein